MVKLKNRIIKIAIIFFAIILLTGCWDYVDIEENTIVLSIGLDFNDGLYDMTGEFALLSKNQSQSEGSGGGQSQVAIFKANGRNFEEARTQINTQINKPMFLGATNLIVLGTNYAKNGIEPYINRIDNLTDYRKTGLIVISRETPLELFELGTDKAMGVGTLIYESLQFLENDKAGIYVDVNNVQADINMEKVGSLIPYIGIEKGEVMILGMAAFRNNKMVGTIDREEMQAAIYLKVKKAKLHEVVSYENSDFAYEMQLKKQKYDFEYKDDKLTITISLKLDAALDHQYYKRTLQEDDFKEMEKILNNQIKTNINNLLNRAQTEFKSDVFGMARQFRAKEYKLYCVLDWEKTYLDSEIKVNVDSTIMDYKLTHTKTKKVR